MKNERIEEWINGNCINEVVEYIGKLDEFEHNNAISKLINDLQNTEENTIRNTIAIVLSDLRCNDAVEPLINLIISSKHKDSRGTLIYALEQLDSSHYLVKLFPLIFEGNYETKWNLRSLMQEKINGMQKKDVDICINLLYQKIDEYEENLQLLYDVAENIFKLSFDE